MFSQVHPRSISRRKRSSCLANLRSSTFTFKSVADPEWASRGSNTSRNAANVSRSMPLRTVVGKAHPFGRDRAKKKTPATLANRRRNSESIGLKDYLFLRTINQVGDGGGGGGEIQDDPLSTQGDRQDSVVVPPDGSSKLPEVWIIAYGTKPRPK